jgi:hypothetical protein
MKGEWEEKNKGEKIMGEGEWRKKKKCEERR